MTGVTSGLGRSRAAGAYAAFDTVRDADNGGDGCLENLGGSDWDRAVGVDLGGAPSNVLARAVVFRGSEEASYITGRPIFVDGGVSGL